MSRSERSVARCSNWFLNFINMPLTAKRLPVSPEYSLLERVLEPYKAGPSAQLYSATRFGRHFSHVTRHVYDPLSFRNADMTRRS